LLGQCVTTRSLSVGTGAGVFAPGHLGELTQVVDTALVDAVVAESGVVQRRVRLLPARVVVFFVLALALFESCSYRQVWGKLVAGLAPAAVAWPCVSGLVLARRRVGAAPLRALFEAVAGPVAGPGMAGVFWRRFRVVAVDGTTLRVPDVAAVTSGGYRKRSGVRAEFGYPLLRLVALVECGTRALIGAQFGPERDGETTFAGRLLHLLAPGMLLLGDCGFDSWRLLAGVQGQGADFVVRSGASRTPLIMARLADGSYLTRLGGGKLAVRVVEAWITVRYADGTVRREQWRLLTSLLDHRRYPATDLIALYHERWQAETTYLSIKSTILDARVLRSRRPAEIEQEAWALLVVYQAIVRITCDAVCSRPGLDPDRASFTIAIETARDQVVLAAGTQPTEVELVGAIGRAVLRGLHPARARQRVKARTRKHAHSNYAPNAGAFPQTTMAYTLDTQIMIMEEGLTPRRKP
jgi:hypothetical protein